MRSLFELTLLPSILIGAVAGCSPPVDTKDELAGESTDQDEFAGNAGAVDDASTYFGIAADLRKCPSPTCGGWFLTRLNRTTTRCHDGRSADACYTPVLDWSEANLPEAQQATLLDACSKDAASPGVYAIVRGRFERTNTTPRPELGRFVISEAWIAEGDTVSDGAFVRVTDNGLRCFVAPCPSLTEDVLNRAQSTNIAGIDWAPAELSDRQIAECVQAMSTRDGVLVAGYYYRMWGPAGTALGRTATAAYYRLTAP